MRTPIETVQDFYAALGAGDIERAMSLMTDDIEWITMLDFPIKDRGPQHVAEGMLIPLVAEWASFALSPTEFIADGVTVVSLGRFTDQEQFPVRLTRKPREPARELSLHRSAMITRACQLNAPRLA